MSLNELTTACETAFASLKAAKTDRSKVAAYSEARARLVSHLQNLLKDARLAERNARAQTPALTATELAEYETGVEDATSNLTETTGKYPKYSEELFVDVLPSVAAVGSGAIPPELSGSSPPPKIIVINSYKKTLYGIWE